MARLSLKGVKKRFKDIAVPHGIDLEIGGPADADILANEMFDVTLPTIDAALAAAGIARKRAQNTQDTPQ